VLESKRNWTFAGVGNLWTIGQHVCKEDPMKKSSVSLLAFGIYLALLGIVLVIAPNFLLAVFGLPPTQEVWIRVAGVLCLILSFYYIQAVRDNVVPFFRWSVYARATVIIFFAAFVLLGFVRPILILFGLIDLAGAIWTWLALRSGTATTR
jgi:hypothetical protein